MLRKNVLAAKSEALLMGFVLDTRDFEKNDFIRMISYVCGVVNLKDVDPERVYDNIYKYSNGEGEKPPITHVVLNTASFGLCMSFVRDEQMQSITDEDGVLAWVENLTAPDLSELGYIYFRKERGRVRRYA